MYFLVKEFQSKPLFPPPFIILVHIYLLVKWVLLKFIKQSQKEHNVAAPKLMEMLSAFEKAIRSDYLDNQIKLNASQSENLLSTINQK